jgi:hypothetical protein
MNLFSPTGAGRTVCYSVTFSYAYRGFRNAFRYGVTLFRAVILEYVIYAVVMRSAQAAFRCVHYSNGTVKITSFSLPHLWHLAQYCP